MEDLVLGLGFLLVILGPLLLVPITWLIHRFGARPVVRMLAPQASTAGIRLVSMALSIALVAAVMALSYYPGKREFDQYCADYATPVISDRVTAEGFYRTRLYPYEASKFLDSFQFVEAPNMDKKGVNLRYSKAGDEVREEEVPAIRSLYGADQDFSQTGWGINLTRKRIYEIATDRELARAAHITYSGGPLSLLLGVYATASCPDIRSEQGSRDFQTFYDLETVILRGRRAGE